MVEGSVVYWMKVKLIHGSPSYTVSKVLDQRFVSLKDPKVKHNAAFGSKIHLLMDKGLAEW